MENRSLNYNEPAKPHSSNENGRPFYDSSSQTGNKTFSIATPSVTNHVLPINDKSDDTSYLQPVVPYQHETDVTSHCGTTTTTSSQDNSNLINLDQVNQNESSKRHMETGRIMQAERDETRPKIGPSQGSGLQIACATVPSEDAASANKQQQKRRTSGLAQDQSASVDGNQGEDATKTMGKKRAKASKKNAKLDPKSKLEKSRQSARECRARKKLRYQYLEDLVCNREKAVIKLRNELSMFCDLSKQMDLGSISELNRRLLVDQVKENTNKTV